METAIYNQKGKEQGKLKLPEAVFAAHWNADLVHQVVLAMQSNARVGTAQVKDRSAVRGGGRKPWKQKGTGRARHGSRRSPIWVGGGVTHGPSTERDHSKKVNKKMKAKALYSVLSKKLVDNEILFVDTLSFDVPKTSDAKQVLEAFSGVKGFEELGTKKHNAALVVIPENASEIKKSFSNFGNVEVEETRNINVVDLLTYKYVIIADPKVSIETLEGKLVKKQ
jgi:large subunit ribosomal protein L4